MSSQTRESGFNQSSPHSSSAKADSYKHEGTPDTRLTAFSPEDGSARSNKLYSSLSLSSSAPQPLRFPGKPNETFRSTDGQQTSDKDPFIASSASTKPDQRLSPTASAFQPFTLAQATQGYGNDLSQGTSSFVGLHPQGQPGPGIAQGLSTGQGLSRYLSLSSHVQALTAEDVEAFLKHLERQGKRLKGKHWVKAHNGKGYLRFTNVHDASMVFNQATQAGNAWRVDLIRPDIWKVVNPENANDDLETEGQVHLMIIIGPACKETPVKVVETVYNLLSQQAEIYAFMTQPSSTEASVKILIEFSDAEAAAAIICRFHGFATEGIDLYLFNNKPDGAFNDGPRLSDTMPSHASRASGPNLSSLFHNMSLSPQPQSSGALMVSNGFNAGHMGMTPPTMGMYPPVLFHNQLQVAPSPPYLMEQFQNRGPSPFSFGANMQPFAPSFMPSTPSTTALVPYQPQSDYIPRALAYRSPEGRRQNAMRVNRSPYYNAASHHNHVDISRIRDGVDVRSTIMLRNIPNKVDQRMLKNIIDQSSWGKYDFMYLRIDFANDCNVGYAFINFVDPLDIIDFVRERGNQRWNCFKSDKVAEISYATIQGKDCLVSKFRNSSVMLEPPHYRPKLYYTTNGPHPELAGQEEPFPGPDNQSKMKRSCENAEHVGLFTPNAGAHIRDEQRRRRSQFDRGTRHAAMEEFEHYQFYTGQ